MKKKSKTGFVIKNIFIFAFAIVMIYPLLWMLSSSFKPTNTIFATAGQLIQTTWTTDNYVNGWKDFGGVGFGSFIRNSLVIALTATLGTIVSSALVG